MDTLKEKSYLDFSYLSRYAFSPVFFDTLKSKYVTGIGQILVKDKLAYFTHTVTRRDTLDSLALKYYNNPTYWWIIAQYNDIQDAFRPLYGSYKVLQIPNLSTLVFEKEKR